MVFSALTLLVATAALLVNAAPNPNSNADNGIEVLKRFSPGHNFGNALEARYAKHHAHVGKRATRKRGEKLWRRSCPANNSTTPVSSSSTPVDDSSTPTESTANTPVDTPAPSSTPDSSSDQSSGNTGSDSGSNNSSDNTDSSTTSSSDVQAYLDSHNGERSKHGADALTWADDLASVAQSWVNGCVWKHSGGQYGENLSTGTGMTPSGAVQLWLNEASQYDPSNPQYSHWTQVVWKGSKEVGCAVATCSGEAMFGTDAYGSAQFYACEYRPAGNIIGEFAENVQA